MEGRERLRKSVLTSNAYLVVHLYVASDILPELVLVSAGHRDDSECE